MLIILTTTIWISILLLAARAAYVWHKKQLRIERDARTRNYNAARILADNLEVVMFGRDYYRAALIEITSVTQADDPARLIAESFLQLESRGTAA